ncbi:MAG: hypothetical protein O3A78_00230 [Nitrospinae bacterium]|jgi:hypothetical protein|nr:hypothetical protein [Nitrospinota bacterium]MDA1108234.1 hypothetical protein [Nitrospinota bacterium]
MAKKTGQRNFFRVMTLIGVVVIGGLGYSFLVAAPKLNDSEYHKTPSSTETCLQCHVRNVDKAPIMPHRPMGSCTFCHRPKEQ